MWGFVNVSGYPEWITGGVVGFHRIEGLTGLRRLTLYQRKSLAKSGATGRGCDRVMYGALVMALLAMLVL